MSYGVVVTAGLVTLALTAVSGWLRVAGQPPVSPVGTEQRRRARRRRGGSGAVLAVGTVAGALVVGPPHGTALWLLIVGVALAGAGLLNDRRRLRPSYRVACEAAAAAVALLLGLRTGLTASPVANAILVVAFVIVVIEALRLLDAAPRAACAVAAPTAAVLSLVALGNEQSHVALVAMALAGGLVGLLVAGARRAFWLGESGCLLSGFLLATLVVDLSPATAGPISVLVVGPLLALPLGNAVVVWLDRLRRRRRLTSRRPDGLPHRLRARPLPWGATLLVLAGAQTVTGLTVLAADRSVIPSAAPLVVAAATLSTVVAAAGGRVHRSAGGRFPRPARWAGLVLAVATAVMVLPAVVVLLSVRTLVFDGATVAERGLAAAREGDTTAAADAFEQAEATLAQAADRLANPLASLGLVVPVLGPNLSAARSLSALGAELASSGANLTAAAPERLTVSRGVVPVEEIRVLAPDLVEAAAVLSSAQRAAAQVERAYLLPSMGDELVEFGRTLTRAANEAEVAAHAATVVPAILGGDGPRRYFLAIQNNAELRATGGFLGNYGELVAEDGELRLERIGRHQDLNEAGPTVKVLDAPDDYVQRYSPFQVASTWESVNLSPDFPTVAGVIAGMYPQSGGRPVDGVIGIDPVGLASLLELTGPVTVENWPEPITAGNVVDVTLNQAYVVFDDRLEERIDFLGAVAAACVDALNTSDLGSPARIVDTLGSAALGGHLSLWFTNPSEQALVDRLAIAGRVDPVEGDSLLVVNQNVSANKIDYYLRRKTTYDVMLRPDGERLGVTGRLRVELENQAPAAGLPDYVIGPFDERFRAGENLSFVSLYTPLTLSDATWDGDPLELGAAQELGRRVYSSFLSIPSRTTRTLEARVEGTVAVRPGGWYELDLLRQPLLAPEEVSVSVEVPQGWRIAETEGARLDGDRRAVAALAVDRDHTIRLRLEPS